MDKVDIISVRKIRIVTSRGTKNWTLEDTGLPSSRIKFVKLFRFNAKKEDMEYELQTYSTRPVKISSVLYSTAADLNLNNFV